MRRQLKVYLKNLQRGDLSLQYLFLSKGLVVDEVSARSFLSLRVNGEAIKGRTLARLCRGARRKGQFLNLSTFNTSVWRGETDFRNVKFAKVDFLFFNQKKSSMQRQVSNALITLGHLQKELEKL